MRLLDYHYKNLLPAVWSPDGELTMRFRAQLADQMGRFPTSRDAVLIGDSVSHYWQPTSSVDVLLPTPEDSIQEAAEQAHRVSGYPLEDTDHPVRFWPIREGVALSVIAKHFGPVYSTNTGVWHGKHVQDEMELRRVEGILQYANWRLYTAKYQEEPFPYEWRTLVEAFILLSEEDRVEVLDALRYRVAQVDRNVSQLLKEQPRGVWKAAEKFDQELLETEELPEMEGIPRKVVLALLHRFRYMDLMEILTDADDRVRRYNRQANDKSTVNVLKDRLLQVFDMVLQRQGGSASAVDVIYSLFVFLLENNRYIVTDMRRRRIAYRLYRRYYLGREEKQEPENEAQ